MRIVRRFYDELKLTEVSPELSVWSAEIVLTDDGKILHTEFTSRKRHPEIFGYINGAAFRASSQKELDDFQKHWSKDRA